VAWVVAVVTVLAGCGGSSRPEPPSSPPPSAGPGAIVVRGTERLAWRQDGDAAGLQFRAYVDGEAVPLDDAICSGPAPETECSSALPPMSDGVHTIAVAALAAASGFQSEPSEPITVQKAAARSVVTAASFPDAAVVPGASRLGLPVTTDDGLAFSVDVVARGLTGPVQLASTPDGRLLIAEAGARVRVVRPGDLESRGDALDAPALLQPSPLGGLGLAVHPDFARNQFVYVSFLARDRTDRALLRIVRLREAGDALGEPLSLFEAPLVASPPGGRLDRDGTNAGAQDEWPRESPRLAFGPDGLLYVLLPPGIEFSNEPAASRPHPSMLRITDEGRVPGVGPLTDVVAHPLGLAWPPSTAALWLIRPGADGEALVQPSGGSPNAAVEESRTLSMTEGAITLSGARVPEAAALEWARSLQGIGPESIGVLRLMVPIRAESVLTGLSGRIIDMVPAGAGTFYLTTSDAPGDPAGGEVVLRLRPRAR
jgi:hypothetical protein